jgi:hypothetical protein
VRCAVGAALVASLAPVAMAAPYRPPFDHERVTVQGQGVAQRYVSGRSSALALDEFRIDIAVGADRHIRDLGVELVEPAHARAWFSDNNGTSPLTLRAAWRDLSLSPVAEHRRISAICESKVCRLNPLPVRMGKVPLLAGFVFHNIPGAKKIRRIAVYPEHRTGPNEQYTYVAVFDVDDRARYTVDVDLLLVDPSVIAGQFNAEADSKPGESYAAVPLRWKKGQLALQGFDVQFTNGSHHLQEFAIEPLKGTNAVRAVYFTDKNDDDPVRAKLWWADLQVPEVAQAKPQPTKVNKPLPKAAPKQLGPAPQLQPGIK